MAERTDLLTFYFPDQTNWNIIKDLIQCIDAGLEKNPIDGLTFSHRHFNKKLRQTCVVCTYSDPSVLLKASNRYEDGYQRLEITRKFLKTENLENGCCCETVKRLLSEWECG